MGYVKFSNIPLPEMLFVALVLGLVTAVVIPPMVYSADTRTAECQANITLINAEIKLYASRHNGWQPADNAELERVFASDKEFEAGSRARCPCGDPYRYNPGTGAIVPHRH